MAGLIVLKKERKKSAQMHKYYFLIKFSLEYGKKKKEKKKDTYYK